MKPSRRFSRQLSSLNQRGGGMRWDGWLMLIIGILLLYGGLAWCLWIAAGRGKKDVWTQEEEDEPEAVIELPE